MRMKRRRGRGLVEWEGSSTLTVVKSVRVIQAAELLQAGMRHSRPVTGHRQSQRLPLVTHRSRPFLVPDEETGNRATVRGGGRGHLSANAGVSKQLVWACPNIPWA